MFKNIIDYLKSSPIRVPNGNEPIVAVGASGLKIDCFKAEDIMVAEEMLRILNVKEIEYYKVKFGKQNTNQIYIKLSRTEIASALKTKEESEEFAEIEEDTEVKPQPAEEEEDEMQKRIEIINKHKKEK